MILTGTIGWDNYDDERSTGPPNSGLGGQRRLLEREKRQLKRDPRMKRSWALERKKMYQAEGAAPAKT